MNAFSRMADLSVVKFLSFGTDASNQFCRAHIDNDRRLRESFRQTGKLCSVSRVARDMSSVRSCAREMCLRCTVCLKSVSCADCCCSCYCAPLLRCCPASVPFDMSSIFYFAAFFTCLTSSCFPVSHFFMFSFVRSQPCLRSSLSQPPYQPCGW